LQNVLFYGIIILSLIGRVNMAVSYNKLWKLLIDKKMKKKDLQQIAGVSASLVTKLGREESVTTVALMKICNALKCDIGDIMEIIPDEQNP
jgi:DNA-binding Xre family transcriptional regulator